LAGLVCLAAGLATLGLVVTGKFDRTSWMEALGLALLGVYLLLRGTGRHLADRERVGALGDAAGCFLFPGAGLIRLLHETQEERQRKDERLIEQEQRRRNW